MEHKMARFDDADTLKGAIINVKMKEGARQCIKNLIQEDPGDEVRDEVSNAREARKPGKS